MNARTLPWVLFVCGIFGAVVLWWQSPKTVASRQGSLEDPQQDPDNRRANLLSAAALLLWTAVFSWLLGLLGFGLAVGVFLMGGFWLLGERRLRSAGLTAIITAILLTLILRFGLGLYLPAGALWALSASGGAAGV